MVVVVRLGRLPRTTNGPCPTLTIQVVNRRRRRPEIVRSIRMSLIRAMRRSGRRSAGAAEAAGSVEAAGCAPPRATPPMPLQPCPRRGLPTGGPTSIRGAHDSWPVGTRPGRPERAPGGRPPGDRRDGRRGRQAGPPLTAAARLEPDGRSRTSSIECATRPGARQCGVPAGRPGWRAWNRARLEPRLPSWRSGWRVWNRAPPSPRPGGERRPGPAPARTPRPAGGSSRDAYQPAVAAAIDSSRTRSARSTSASVVTSGGMIRATFA